MILFFSVITIIIIIVIIHLNKNITMNYCYIALRIMCYENPSLEIVFTYVCSNYIKNKLWLVKFNKTLMHNCTHARL